MAEKSTRKFQEYSTQRSVVCDHTSLTSFLLYSLPFFVLYINNVDIVPIRPLSSKGRYACAVLHPSASFQALSTALEVPMEVFSAMSPPLLLGQEHDGAPLLLSYHEHYYALGAHYNSVVPA